MENIWEGCWWIYLVTLQTACSYSKARLNFNFSPVLKLFDPITVGHEKQLQSFFLLKCCKNITNFLLWILWTCLAITIMVCLSACKKWTSLLTFLKYCKDLLTFYFEYFENAWSCSSIIIVSPCRKLWSPNCWNQLVGHFDVYLHAKIQLYL